MNYCLPKSKVFRGKADFQKVYEKGKSWANRYLVLYVLSEPQTDSKVGFAAGKRLGSSPVRNRVKRLLREAYRLHQHEIREGTWLVLVGRSALIGSKREAAEKALLRLAGQSGILLPSVSAAGGGALS